MNEAEPFIALLAVSAVVFAIIAGWYKDIWERRNR
jgi:hypothetical protein